MLLKHSLKRLDQLGATLSFACALHCVFQPMLFLILPIFGLGFFLNHYLETWILILAVLLASLTLITGWLHHKNKRIFIPLVLSTALIFLSCLPALASLEVFLAVSGALGLTLSHLLNLQLSKNPIYIQTELKLVQSEYDYEKHH